MLSLNTEHLDREQRFDFWVSLNRPRCETEFYKVIRREYGKTKDAQTEKKDA